MSSISMASLISGTVVITFEMDVKVRALVYCPGENVGSLCNKVLAQTDTSTSQTLGSHNIMCVLKVSPKIEVIEIAAST